MEIGNVNVKCIINGDWIVLENSILCVSLFVIYSCFEKCFVVV